jgi:hypothetical protein
MKTSIFSLLLCLLTIPVAGQAGIGDTLKSTKLSLIVLSVEAASEITAYYTQIEPSEGAVYVTVQYKYKNISGRPLGSMSQPIITLIDPMGNEYEPDARASAIYSLQMDNDEKVISELNPGITSKGSKVFEISEELLKKSGWHLLIKFDNVAFRIACLGTIEL